MANEMLRDLDRLQTVLEETAEELNELSGKLYDAREKYLGTELSLAADLNAQVVRMVAQVRSTLLIKGLK